MKGGGVRTLEDIEPNKFVVVYKGELLKGSKLKEREAYYTANPSKTGCYLFYFKHNEVRYCVDGTTDRGNDGFGRMINHSQKKDKMNLKPVIVVTEQGVPYIVFYSSRAIAKGEELLFDYGERNKLAVKFNPWLKE